MNRRTALLSTLILLLAIYCFTAGQPYSWQHFPLDDAWIFRVYARSLVFGQGFTYSSGQEAGLTSPLWTLVTAPAQLVEVAFGVRAMVVAVKCIGILTTLWFLLASLRVANLLIPTSSTSSCSGSIGYLFAATLVSFDGSLLFSALSGMESILVAALWMELLYSLLARRGNISVYLAALLPLARPEAIIVSLAVYAWLLGEQPGRSACVKNALIVLLPSCLWASWCFSVTAHFLPNSFYFKSTPQSINLNSWAILAQSLQLYGMGSLGFILPQLSFILIAPLIAWRTVAKERASFTLLLFGLVLPLAYLFAVIISRPMLLEGYYWSRWCDPALHVLVGVTAASIPLLINRVSNCRPLCRTLSALTLLAIFIGAPRFAASFSERAKRLSTDSFAIFHNNEQAGDWLREHADPSAQVATVDAGAIRYLSGLAVVDVAGLHEHRILFGELSRVKAIAGSDYIAIFPNFLPNFSEGFELEERVRFSLSETEYTICPCPDQRELAIYKVTPQSASTGTSPGA